MFSCGDLFHNIITTSMIITIIKGSIEGSWAAPDLSACLGRTPDTWLRCCPASRMPSVVVRVDIQHAPPATRNPSTANYKQFPCLGWGEERERGEGRKSSCQPKADTHGSVYKSPVVWLCHGNTALTLAGMDSSKVRPKEGVLATVAAFDGLQGGLNCRQRR